MDNNSPVRFRTSLFGGYKQSDVIEFIKEESKASQEAIAEKNSHIAKLNQQLEEANEALAAEMAKGNADLEERLRVKETVVDGLTEDISVLRANIAELEEKLRIAEETPAQDTSVLEATVEDLQEKLAAAEQNAESMSAANAQLQEKLANAANAPADDSALREKLATLEAMNSALEAKNGDLEAKNGALEAKNAENADLAQKLAALQTAATDDSALQEKIAAITLLNEENTSLRAKIAELQSQPVADSALTYKLEQEKSALQSKATELEEKLYVKGTVIDGLNADKIALSAKIADLEEKYAKLSGSSEDLAAEKKYLVDLEIAARRRADQVEEESNRRVEELSRCVRDRMTGAEERLVSFSSGAQDELRQLLDGLSRYSDTLLKFSGVFEEAKQSILTSVGNLESICQKRQEGEK